MTDPRRRLLLQCAALLPFAVALPSCARKKEDFLATDITGVDWGRDFRLADASGRMRTLADFRGKAVLLSFGYTHCADVCPTTLSNMARAVDLLGDDGKRVQGLFVTLDPARDTPEVLARYVPAFHADFIGLTGSETQIEHTAQDFKFFFARQAPDATGFYTVDHQAVIFAFDPQGRLRLYFGGFGGDSKPEFIAHDLWLLLKS